MYNLLNVSNKKDQESTEKKSVTDHKYREGNYKITHFDNIR